MNLLVGKPSSSGDQYFEYSYELIWKVLKRHLELVVPDPEFVDHWSFKELMRESAERGLIPSVEPWLEYGYQRTSRRLYRVSCWITLGRRDTMTSI